MDETLGALPKARPAKCGGADHFASQCNTNTPKPRCDGKSKEKKTIRYLHDEYDKDEEDEYVFTVKSASPPETVARTVGGVEVAVVIDSGASTNVIDEKLWSKLKQEKIDCVSMKSDKKLYAFRDSRSRRKQNPS